MTLVNSKRLYAHYLEIGNSVAAQELLKIHPELDTPMGPVEEPKEEPVEEEQPKPSKSKKNK